jgi:uncharacterized membrane protein
VYPDNQYGRVSEMNVLQTGVSVDRSATAESVAVRTYRSYFAWLLIGVAIAAGICFRICDLDRKVFWQDEIDTRCYIAPRNLKVELGYVFSKQELLQRVEIDRSKSVVDVTQNLAYNAAEQLPLYYVVARSWVDMLGDSTLNLRLLSAIFGIAGIAAAYFLGLELFENRLAGGFAAALTAVSPFLLNTGGQARPYSFWTLTLVAASVVLLRTLKAPTPKRWLGWFAILTVSLYSHLFSLLFLASVCVWITINRRWSKGFALSTGASLLCVAPWVYMWVDHHTPSDRLVREGLTLWDHLGWFIRLLVRGFLSCKAVLGSSETVIVVGLFVAAIVIVCRSFSPRCSTFLLCLLLVPMAALTVFGQYTHQLVLSVDRYDLPSLLAAPYFVVGALFALSRNRGVIGRTLYAVAAVAFLGMGLYSCCSDFLTNTWHHRDAQMLQLAEAVNAQPGHLLVTDAPGPELVVVAGMLKDDAKVMSLETYDLSPTSWTGGYTMAHVQRKGSHNWTAEYYAPGQAPVSLNQSNFPE